MPYKFEKYRLDPDRRELRCGADVVSIAPQVFDLLEYLVRNCERIVSKDDLIADVWDGRVVSDSTLSSRISAVRYAIADSGKEQRLLRTVSRRGFRFVGAVHNELEPTDGSDHPVSEDAATRPSRKPTIAILPFVDLAATEQASFVTGLVEDITTALTQFSWLSVVARSSSAVYQGWAVDIGQLERSLGVHYALEGSVRRAEHRVRVTARLIDTATKVHLWADRFDVWQEDLLDLQDQICTRVVGAIGPKLEQVEIDRARRASFDSGDAIDCYLRGLGNVYQWSRDGISNALSQFHRAIEIDPGMASAYGMAAYCYVQRKSYGWVTDGPVESAECARLARRAAELARNDAFALSKAAHAIAAVGGDIDSGAAFVERALTINPNLAVGWYVSGWIKLFLGAQEQAIEHLDRAMRMSQFDPLSFKVQAALAYAHFFCGNHDQASAMATNALHTRPHYLTALRGAAAGHAHAGRLDEARRLIGHMRSSDSTLRVANLSALLPFQRADHFGKWADALQKAGLPD